MGRDFSFWIGLAWLAYHRTERSAALPVPSGRAVVGGRVGPLAGSGRDRGGLRALLRGLGALGLGGLGHHLLLNLLAARRTGPRRQVRAAA